MTLSEPSSGVTLSDATATGTITDNDDPPALSIAAPAAVAEGDSGSTNMVFTVTLGATSGRQVTVDYAVDSTSTATSGADFTALAGGTLTFAAGSTGAALAKTVTVAVTGDELDESDETVVLKLSNAVGATLPDPATASGTITDDDASPVLAALTAQAVTAGEDVDITASATDGDGDTVTYEWTRKAGETTPPLPNGTALDEDQLTFTTTAPGTYTMTVTASDGNGNEDTGTVAITVTAATTTPTVSLSIADVSAAEDGTFTFTVTADPAPSSEVTFKYTVTAESGDTATADTDFTAVTTAVAAAIAANETTAAITVSVTDDALDESDETFTVTLSEPSSGVTLSDATATGTITDNDTAGVTVSPTSLTVAEGSSGEYTVQLDTEPTADVTVTVGGESGEVTVTGSPLTFTPSNYGTAQTVTVNAGSDTDTTNDAATLTHAASSSDTNYGSSLSIEDVSVTVTDTTPSTAAPCRIAISSLSHRNRRVLQVTVSVPANCGPVPKAEMQVKTAAQAWSDVSWIALGNLALSDSDQPQTVTRLFNLAPPGLPALTGLRNVRVRALNGAKAGPESVVAHIWFGPLAQPAGLRAAAGNRHAKLSWTAAANPTLTGWEYRQKPDGGNYGEWTAMSGSGAATTSYSAPGLSNGTEYTFQIRSRSGSAASAASSAVTATPTAGVPLQPELTSSEPGDGRVRVIWRALGDPSVTKWQSRRKLDSAGNWPGTWTNISGSDAATTSHVFTGLTNGTPYTFQVRAVNDQGAGPASTGLSATPSVEPFARPTGVGAKAGNGRVTLSWADPGNASITKWQYRGKLAGASAWGAATDVSGSDAETTSAVVTGLTNSSAYHFQVRAFGTVGGHWSPRVSATPLTPPGAPQGLATSDGDSQVALRWRDQGDRTITGWEYRLKPDGGAYGDWTAIDGSGAGTTSHTVTGLVNGTEYTFQVRAENAGGKGPSSEVTATPVRGPPAAPTGLTATSGDGRVTLSWDSSDDDRIRRWNYRQKAGAGAYGRWRAVPGDAGTTSHTVTGLVNATKYTFQVRAETLSEFGKAAAGITATPTAATTTAVSLSIADASAAEAAGTMSFTVTSTPAPSSPITFRYAVTAESGDTATAGTDFTGVSSATEATIAASAASAAIAVSLTDDVLVEGDETFTVTLSSPSAGVTISDAAATGTITDDDSLPSAPSGFEATAGNARAALSWDDPEDASITRYELRQKEGSNAWGSWTAIADSDAETTDHTVTGLENGSAYSFRIRAVNPSGSGAQSSVVTATPQANPAKPVLTATAGDGQVTLGWQLQPGIAIATWTYQYSSDGGSTWGASQTVTGASATSTVVTGLENDTEYTFRMFAAVGPGAQSAWSDFVKATPQPPAPAAPTNFSASPGNARVELTWDDPEDASISVWQLRYGKQGETWGSWTPISGSDASTTSHAVTSLDNGSTYRFRIRAKNSGGLGAPSPVATATPLVLVKPAVTATAGDGRVTLSWPSQPGSGVTAWGYQSSSDGGTSWTSTQTVTGGGTTSTVVSGLTNGTEYTFRMFARAGSAQSSWSDHVKATPIPPALSIADVTAAEDGTFAFTVTAAPAPASGISFKYTVTAASGDTATAGADFTAVTTATSATIAANASSATITVSVTDDALDEPDETFTVTLSEPSSGVTLGDATATGTITDNDDPPALSIAAPAAVTEGDSGSADMVFAVTLGATSGRRVTVDYAVDSGASTATSGTDFTALAAGTLTFAAGSTGAALAKTVTVAVTGDESDETDETVVLKLSDAVGATLPDPATASGAIEDDDASPVLASLTAQTVTAGEDVDITASATDGDGDAVTYAWTRKAGETTPAIPNGTALNAAQLTFTTTAPGTYTMTVTASDGNGNTDTKDVVLTVTQPAPAALTISVADASVMEGDSGETDMNFTVTLSGSPSHQVEIQATAWAKDSGDTAKGGKGAGRDFIGFQRRKLVFAANATGAALSKTVTVKILGDEVDEDDETFTLRLNVLRTTDSRVAFAGGETRLEATGTITDDDDATAAGHTISVEDVSVAEGDSHKKAMNFTVTLSGSPSHQVEIKATAWAKDSGDAAKGGRGPGQDFIGFRDRKIVFEANATGASLSKTVAVQVLGDEVDEDDETFTLLLNNLRTADSRVVFAGGESRLEATGTITDDDDATATGHEISVADAEAVEGDSGRTELNFTVTLSGSPSHEVQVDAVAREGTAEAGPGKDFRHFQANRKVVFAADATGAALSRTVTVHVLGDEADEDDETFTLRLNNIRTNDHRVVFAGGGTRLEATGTITDDDTAGVTIAPTSVTVAEGGSNTYTAKLDTKPSSDVTVTVGGESGEVTVTGSPLTFTPSNWKTAQTVTVNAAADPDTTDDSATLTHASASSDANYGPSLSIDDVEVTVTEPAPSPSLPAPEGLSASAGDARVTLSWTDPGNENITVWQLRYGKVGAVWGSWSDISGSSAGTASHTVSSLDNGSEYRFQIRAAAGSDSGAASAAVTATPFDANAPRVVVTPTELTINEGSGAKFAVVLAGARPTGTVTVEITSVVEGLDDRDIGELVFEPYNWDEPQRVTEYAVVSDDVGDRGWTTRLDVSAPGTNYADVEADDVTVTVADATATLTLADDPAAVTEGSDISLTVTSDREVTGVLPVELTLSARGASGFDADDIPGDLTQFFDADFGGDGGTTGTVLIPTSADTAASEGAESYTITLVDNSAWNGYKLGDDVAAEGTLNDGASGSPPVVTTPKGVTVTPTTLTVDEGGTATYTVVLDAAPSDDVTVVAEGRSGDVTFTTQGQGSDGGNWGRLVFTTSNWDIPQLVRVWVLEDADMEDDAAVTLSHTASGGGYDSVSIDSVTITVTEDDKTMSPGGAEGSRGPAGSAGPPASAPGQPQGFEAEAGDGEVALSWSDPGDATITHWQLRVRRGTAGWSAWTDMAGSGAATTSHTVTGLDNGAEYRFRIRAVNASGAGERSPRVFATPFGPPEISIADASADEGETLVFALTLSAPSAREVSVAWRPAQGGSYGTAESGSDFVGDSGVARFAPGVVRAEIRIETLDDSHDEGRETFAILLSDAEGGAIADGEATGAIVNSDPMPRAWLGRFGRAVAEDALDGIAERIGRAGASARAPGPGFQGAFGGVQLGGPGAASNACGAATVSAGAGTAAQAAGAGAETEAEAVGAGAEAEAVGAGFEPARECLADEFGFMADHPRNRLVGGRLLGGYGMNGAAGLRGPQGGATYRHGMNGDATGGIPGGGTFGGGLQGSAGSMGYSARSGFGGGSAFSSGPAGFGAGAPVGFGQGAPVGFGAGAPGHFDDASETGFERLLAANSHFAYTREEDPAGGVLGFWGRGSRTRFDGREEALDLDGEVATALLGADYAKGNWLAGVALAQSRSDGGYRGGSGAPGADGGIEASLTAAIPYAAWRSSGGLSLWGAAGAGAGALALDPGAGGSLGTDIGWAMAAAGARSDLFAFADGGSLALVSDALWTRATSARADGLAAAESDVGRLRVGLEGSRRFALPGGGGLTPKLEIGARRDGGDAETGFGIEVGGGLAWADPRLGLALDVEGRALLTHEDGAMRDRGLSASLAYDPSPGSTRGLLLALRRDLGGSASGGLAALFEADPLARGAWAATAAAAGRPRRATAWDSSAGVSSARRN